jgi:hypothetical protein
MANTITVKQRFSLGDRWLVAAEITGDGSATSITALSLGLTRIDLVWWADVDDDNALQTSTYAGTSITTEAISSGKKQLLFCIGH